MNRLFAIGALILILVFFAWPSYSERRSRIKIAGIYSDLSFHRESGDLLGNEVLIVFSKTGYFVVFQSSEGEPIVPVVAPLNVKGNEIRFTLPFPENDRGEFLGHISVYGLEGSFQATGQQLNLKRKNSYWQ